MVKHNADRRVERNEAQFVTKKFAHTYGVDYQQTRLCSQNELNSSPITLAANLNWYIEQLHWMNVLLHGNLQKEVQMELPFGLRMCLKSKVCMIEEILVRTNTIISSFALEV